LSCYDVVGHFEFTNVDAAAAALCLRVKSRENRTLTCSG
jgi:hypothetical protein